MLPPKLVDLTLGYARCLPTNVYIDGFNLYYGALRGTQYKWLGLEALCRALLPQHQVQHIRYFTARIKGKPNDVQAPQRQQAYLRALETLPSVRIHHGHFLSHPARMPLVYPPPGGPATVEVIKTEEKGSDVNLATWLVRDGFRGEYDTAVVISNDSDLTEPIRLVKQEFSCRIGIFNPHPLTRRSAELRKAGPDFHRQINPSALGAAQFPPIVRDPGGRAIHKPPGW